MERVLFFVFSVVFAFKKVVLRKITNLSYFKIMLHSFFNHITSPGLNKDQNFIIIKQILHFSVTNEQKHFIRVAPGMKFYVSRIPKCIKNYFIYLF